ncbi:MAG TPA: hypothetical protein VFS05_04800 [Gemmatimonadaceae bacterium]|nr:hypothetical protein [Gemmatimonadaceae bacterium]
MAVRPHRLAASCAALALALAAPARPAPAQGARRGAAPAVALRIQPRVGDTIRVRLEQRLDMTARRDSAARYPGAAVAMSSSMGTLALIRHIVQGSDDGATTILVLLDSLALDANGMPRPSEAERRRLQGRRYRVRVTPQGAMTLVDPDGVSVEGATFGTMPATLPAGPVAAGAKWTRTVEIPIAGQAGSRAVRVDVVFRLDSVTHGSDLAFVSMRGNIARDSTPDLPPGVKRITTGSLRGSMVVDRQRGWVAESRTTLEVRSTVTRSDAPSFPPLEMNVWVMQHIQMLP